MDLNSSGVFCLLCGSFCLAFVQCSTAASDASPNSFEFEAVEQLHRQIDDDHSGRIDVTELTGFVAEELEVAEEKERRKKTMPTAADHDGVTVADLWRRWEKSSERNWTADQLVIWLDESAGLPQYGPVAIKHQLDGKILPKLAVPPKGFYSQQLGITNPVHKKKIQLKAMDAVLFGYKLHRRSYLKDVLFVTLVTVALAAYFWASTKAKSAEAELKRLSAHMESLKGMEAEFSQLQQTLHKEKNDNNTPSASSPDLKSLEEIAMLKTQLSEKEKLLELRVGDCSPVELVPLLRRTYQREIAAINADRKQTLTEMSEAREMVEKLQKKRHNFITQFRIAQFGDDEIDAKINGLRKRLEKIVDAASDCQLRWGQIESLCGFPIVCPSPMTQESFEGIGKSVGGLTKSASGTRSFKSQAGFD